MDKNKLDNIITSYYFLVDEELLYLEEGIKRWKKYRGINE